MKICFPLVFLSVATLFLPGCKNLTPEQNAVLFETALRVAEKATK